MRRALAGVLAVLTILATAGSAALAARLGSEFQVNTFTRSNQQGPSVSGLSDGGFVAVWTSQRQDGSSNGAYGQRYAANGVRAGVEFRVNTSTEGSQQDPSVAGLSGGGFVVAWAADQNNISIYGQRYDVAGAPVGTEFLIGGPLASVPVVAALADGGFVVVWQARDQNAEGVFGQRFTADGSRAGAAFPVNTFTLGTQDRPSVAGLIDGGFVVTWESDGRDGSGWGIYGQRYDMTGAALGVEFRVNTHRADDQVLPVLAGLTDGSFVVVWMSEDGSDYGIYGRRYAADGSPEGKQFRINRTTVGNQGLPSVAPLDDGGFVVAWASVGQDGSDSGIVSQSYDASRTRVGKEYQVNTPWRRSQDSPAVARLKDDRFVVTWESIGQDGGAEGIFGQRCRRTCKLK